MGVDGETSLCKLHVQAESAGIARQVITKRDADLLRSALMDGGYQIYKNNQVFRSIF